MGWIDDWRKVIHRNPKGLSARQKLLWQSLIGLLAAVYLALSICAPSNAKFVELFMDWMTLRLTLPPRADLIVPFFEAVVLPLGRSGASSR